MEKNIYKLEYNKYLQCNNGFTLAEVLLTLVIIGIVASMTIPNIFAHFTEKATVVRLKKTYSLLNSAVKSAVAINGPVDYWEFGNASAKGANSVIFNNTIKPYLNITKDCKTGTGCWDTSYTMYLNGITREGDFDKDTTRARMILSDGIFLQTNFSAPDCNIDAASASTNHILNHACGTINIDINGFKGPNILGIDIFDFYITKNGDIVPLGIEGNNHGTWGWIGQCRKNGSGQPCASWVLYKENMNYLRGESISHW
ncbi:type II secretion system protein [bacterium]|nr:type II secretion system protein [bacterium]